MIAHPLDPSDLASFDAHFFLLLQAGDYRAAGQLADCLSPETPTRRFRQALGLSQVDFELGGAGDLGHAHRLLVGISDGRGRAYADFAMAFEEARRALIGGGDWQNALINRPGNRPPPDRIQGIATFGHQQIRIVGSAIAALWLALIIESLVTTIWR